MTEDRLASDANQIDHDCLAAFSSILAQHKGVWDRELVDEGKNSAALKLIADVRSSFVA
jgi:hypothetical protein